LKTTSKANGKIFVIGIGPGSESQMTLYARETLGLCDVIIGYDTYIDLIKHLLKPSQEIIRAGMTEEVYRAQKAVELARGENQNAKNVGVISSGDSGLYGMAGLIYEVLDKMNANLEVDVEIVPGVTALISAASLLGSPVMHDFCAISLSDHLTPWKTIEKRLELAALGDFVIALYNPKSGRRKEQIVRARDILLKHRDPENPVGIVTAAYRPDQSVVITDIAGMLDYPMGMMTTIMIGNSTTSVIHGKMITPRGYHKKYDLDKTQQDIKLSDRLNARHEPWALKNSVENLKDNSANLLSDEKEITKNEGHFSFNSMLTLKENQSGNSLHKYFIKTREFVNDSGADSEKIFNIKFLNLIGKFLTENSRIESSSDGRLSIICNEIDESVKKELHKSGLDLFDDESFVIIKKCNFCEGDKIESLPWLSKLNDLITTVSVPGQLHIGFNGCGMSCHGAVMEDIGIVYFRGDFEVYVGGKKMGRNVRLPLYTHLHLSGEEMIAIVENIVSRYKSEAFHGEKFFKYILRTSEVQKTAGQEQ